MFRWCYLCPSCPPFNDWWERFRKLSIASLSLRLMIVFRFVSVVCYIVMFIGSL